MFGADRRGDRIGRDRMLALPGVAVWTLIFGAVAGCGTRGDAEPSPAYLPSREEAREALGSVMSTWRDAATPVTASFDTPAVRFVDKQRRPGQRLHQFEILNGADVEGARQFTVRLHLEGEETPSLVRYNVLGREPIWVFRMDDLEMLSHWEHDMNVPPAASEGQNGSPKAATTEANAALKK